MKGAQLFEERLSNSEGTLNPHFPLSKQTLYPVELQVRILRLQFFQLCL